MFRVAVHLAAHFLVFRAFSVEIKTYIAILLMNLSPAFPGSIRHHLKFLAHDLTITKSYNTSFNLDLCWISFAEGDFDLCVVVAHVNVAFL